MDVNKFGLELTLRFPSCDDAVWEGIGSVYNATIKIDQLTPERRLEWFQRYYDMQDGSTIYEWDGQCAEKIYKTTETYSYCYGNREHISVTALLENPELKHGLILFGLNDGVGHDVSLIKDFRILYRSEQAVPFEGIVAVGNFKFVVPF